MISDIIKELEIASTNINHSEFSAYECKCLLEYIHTINELVNKQADTIKVLTLEKENRKWE